MKILMVSNDPAGAELLSSWARLNVKHDYSFVLGLPAEKIFKRKIQSLMNILSHDFESKIQDYDCVMTGTSQTSNLEKRAIAWSKKYNVKVISILDYWVNYATRFFIDGSMVFPDEVWVMDKYALLNAKKELLGANILLHKNPYIEEIILKKIPKSNSESRNNILYVCQPFNEDNLTDIDAIDYFFSRILKHESQLIKIRLRLHPLEVREKYECLLKKYKDSFEISLTSDVPLSDDLNWAGSVVGMHAQALAVSVAFGLKTFHCIPPKGKRCVLPHSEILDFDNFYNIK
mgnify:FL=1|jgi:hypothetical protein